MNDEKDLVNAAIRTAAGIYLQQVNDDNLYGNNRENYNSDILKIAELLILANSNEVTKDKLDNITIYLAEISRK